MYNFLVDLGVVIDGICFTAVEKSKPLGQHSCITFSRVFILFVMFAMLIVCCYMSVATVIVSCSVFWFFNALLMILDLTGRPQYLLRYKIQEGKNQPVGFSFHHEHMLCFRNHLIVLFAVTYHFPFWLKCGLIEMWIIMRIYVTQMTCRIADWQWNEIVEICMSLELQINPCTIYFIHIIDRPQAIYLP